MPQCWWKALNSPPMWPLSLGVISTVYRAGISQPINSIELKKFHLAHQTANVNQLAPETGYSRPGWQVSLAN